MILLAPFAALIALLLFIVFRLGLEEWRNIKLERERKKPQVKSSVFINGKSSIIL